MKRVEDSKIDWYNTRAGRTVIRPTVGDGITWREVLGIPKPKKKYKDSRGRRGLGYKPPKHGLVCNNVTKESKVLSRRKYNPVNGVPVPRRKKEITFLYDEKYY